MDPRDIALQNATPTVMVPRFGSFEPMDEPGHRFLSASDGLWLELRRAWLYLRLPIARQNRVAMPYGSLEPVIEFVFGTLSGKLVDQFLLESREKLPNEHAAWITWNEENGNVELHTLEAINARPDLIHFHRPALDDCEHLVLDLHSHGRLPAFFSRETDDIDDRGEVKIAGVVGNIDTPQPTTAFRLCVLGMFLPLPGLAKGGMEI